ncbi:MAG: hypothetical protein ACFE8A_13985 [Candidatus Hodarchaeota archaeon]
MTKKKSNFLGFRLGENEINRLDYIAKLDNKSRSMIAKQAVENWINLESFRKTNNMFVITKSMFLKLVSIAEEDTLNDLAAEMAYLIADVLRYVVIKPINSKSFNIYSKNIINLLGISGIRWFNSLDLSLNERKIIVKGLHDLDDNFAYFFIKVILNLLETHFNFDLKEIVKEYSSNLIYLEYQIKV